MSTLSARHKVNARVVELLTHEWDDYAPHKKAPRTVKRWCVVVKE